MVVASPGNWPARARRCCCWRRARIAGGGASGGLSKRGSAPMAVICAMLPLMRMAYEQWPTLHEELGHDTGYARLAICRSLNAHAISPSASAL
ncbi:MAG: hypothetical protein R2932_04055 [Caldilineaceae bacterium]